MSLHNKYFTTVEDQVIVQQYSQTLFCWIWCICIYSMFARAKLFLCSPRSFYFCHCPFVH